MALAGHGFDLIGISLFGPKPLEAVHLEFSDGLSVLYGLNGSGKTTILREAEAVLRGVGPDQPGGVSSRLSCLHVRFTSLQESPVLFEGSQFEKSLVESFLGSKETLDVPTHETRFERWQWMLDYCLRQELDVEWIWDEPVLAHQDTISVCLLPRGTPDRPAWWSCLSARLSESEWAALNDALERQRNILNKALTTNRLSVADLEFGNNPVSVFGENYWTRTGDGKGGLETDHLGQWPVHFPLPVSDLGKVSVPPVHVISDSGSIASTRDATNNLLVSLAEEYGELIEIADPSETRLNPQFRQAVERLERDANAFLELTGPHLFKLELELKSPHEWFVGEIPEWTASSIDETSMGLGRLSGAELRWALAALQWTISGIDTSRPQIFLIDEPERGLHRLREQELPRMLRNLCTRSENLMVLAASHAPSFLDVRVGRLHHVTRLPGYPTALRAIDLGSSALMSESAESLGLAPSDLLQLTRVFVLVEGAHDEIVLTSALGDDIRRARGRIIPIYGATHARSIADARILFDATAASIVFVLDNVNSGPALDIWNQATQEYREGKRKAAKATLARLSRLGTGGETLWLQALGERAVDTNVIHRIKPFGLSKRDILCYLPPSAFMPGDTSWEELSAAYERAKRGGLTKENFKSWLTKMRGADFSREKVEKAAQTMGASLPREFTELSIAIQSRGLLGPVDDLDISLND